MTWLRENHQCTPRLHQYYIYRLASDTGSLLEFVDGGFVQRFSL